MVLEDLFKRIDLSEYAKRDLEEIRDYFIENAYEIKEEFDKKYDEGLLLGDDLNEYRGMDSIEFISRTPLFKDIRTGLGV